MQKKMAKKLAFCGVGAAALTASTSAQASPGCDSANAGAFNQSTPANTNLLTQTGGTFDVGDTLFATATGTPLGVGVDLLPGFDTILVLNGANGTGSHTLTVGGPRTIDITLAGGPGGAAFLNFTCTPVATPPTPGPGAGPGAPTPAAPDSTEQSDTATNSTTTSVVVENSVVNGLVDGAAQEDPTPAGPTQAELDERRNLEQEAVDLFNERRDLEERAKQVETAITGNDRRLKSQTSASSRTYPDENLSDFVELTVPIDTYEALEDLETRQRNASIRQLKAIEKQLHAEAERIKSRAKGE